MKQKQFQIDGSRLDKAQIIANSRQIVKIHRDSKHWLVESEATDGKFYKAGFDDCECMDFKTRNEVCKHNLALSIWLGGNV